MAHKPDTVPTLEQSPDHMTVDSGPTKRAPSRLVLIGIVLVVVGLGGSALLYHNSQQSKTSQSAAIPAPTPIPAVKTENAQITLTSIGFTPATLRLKAGSQVTWTNTDTAAHNLTSAQLEDLDSELLNPQDSYSFTFEKAGTYQVNSSGQAGELTVTVVE